MYRGVIYLRISPSVKYYVGLTTNEIKRQEHWLNTKRDYGGYLIRDARKRYLPETWSYAVLAEVFSPSRSDLMVWLNALEVYFIWRYDSNNPEHGYNLTRGGEGRLGYKCRPEVKARLSALYKGRPLSEETKAKLSRAAKGRKASEETRRKLSAAHKGRKHSEAARRAMSLALRGVPHHAGTGLILSAIHKGRRLDPSHVAKLHAANRKAVLQYSLSGELLAEFDSAVEASAALGVCYGPISQCCRGTLKTAYGFKWVFKNPAPPAIKRSDRYVGQFSWEGELLHVYPSAVAAAKATYGLVYGIRGCCRGEHITSGGFRWHYVHKDTHAIIYPINK